MYTLSGGIWGREKNKYEKIRNKRLPPESCAVSAPRISVPSEFSA